MTGSGERADLMADVLGGSLGEEALSAIEGAGEESQGGELSEEQMVQVAGEFLQEAIQVLQGEIKEGGQVKEPTIESSPFLKHLTGYLRKEQGQQCEQGENASKTGCIPKKKGPSKTPAKKPPQPKASKAPPAQAANPKKPAATRGDMASARREGKGKEGRIVMADGSPAPAHIKLAMVPPDWTDVKVALDPSADVLVTARDNKGRTKTVYSDQFHMRSAAVKFGRIKEAMDKRNDVWTEVQQARYDPKTAEEADCFWLIMAQGTRPGSESDTGAKVKAYGATTLEGRHVTQLPNGEVRLYFIGKEGVRHNHRVRDERVARMLLERAKAAGPNGKLFNTSDSKLRDFVAKLDGGGFLTKDFRTLLATRMAAQLIEEVNNGKGRPDPADQKSFKKAVKEIAEKVSSVLGNKPAQAIESYILPEMWGQLGMPPAHERRITRG